MLRLSWACRSYIYLISQHQPPSNKFKVSVWFMVVCHTQCHFAFRDMDNRSVESWSFNSLNHNRWYHHHCHAPPGDYRLLWLHFYSGQQRSLLAEESTMHMMRMWSASCIDYLCTAGAHDTQETASGGNITISLTQRGVPVAPGELSSADKANSLRIHTTG